ncbi:hypothetical protein CWB89_06360 [Pseudoalteromonas piscicida]|uniref:Uncharacterized protein n=1 Tax=Pseudoalteromonas piscicida TaxID=43662 RepID=A0AAQ2EUX2_PSEO7|nr:MULTISPECIES: hypothetical protein [Pseudoalteromonas]KJY90360.1 hypothetical protein TW75_06905 [Pseudoalteromonas piscicida]TMN43605.1 hypothetical protein CWB95_05065 [Pseudoalteromonas piscicida]TMN44054.1 hypothetical protein CWB94_01515 [Pseudoalteromonas piscicida]TMN56829.1 hypothetical protein CWB92_01690 [Pseudoalteromonas piscicida]TMN57426.1 hypothetical protein CWB91_03475 [Pseudoalteromonas piscicida]
MAVVDERTFSDLFTDKYPHIFTENAELEISGLADGNRAEHKKVRQGFVDAFKRDNPEKFDKVQNNHINKSNITNFLQHGITELLSYREQQLKEYISKQNDAFKHIVLLFAAKLISVIDVKTIQKFAENDVEIREALHASYQKVEDALEANCINRVGDLLEDKKVRASILMNAAKSAKKQGLKFDPSEYIPNYECYNKKLHGNPVVYLKKHFGEFLASCNEEKIDYLYRGDIVFIDSKLSNALYGSYQTEFESLVHRAGKKSATEVRGMTERGEYKFKKISSLTRNSH